MKLHKADSLDHSLDPLGISMFGKAAGLSLALVGAVGFAGLTSATEKPTTPLVIQDGEQERQQAGPHQVIEKCRQRLNVAGKPDKPTDCEDSLINEIAPQ